MTTIFGAPRVVQCAEGYIFVHAWTKIFESVSYIVVESLPLAAQFAEVGDKAVSVSARLVRVLALMNDS